MGVIRKAFEPRDAVMLENEERSPLASVRNRLAQESPSPLVNTLMLLCGGKLCTVHCAACLYAPGAWLISFVAFSSDRAACSSCRRPISLDHSHHTADSE